MLASKFRLQLLIAAFLVSYLLSGSTSAASSEFRCKVWVRILSDAKPGTYPSSVKLVAYDIQVI